MRDEFRHEKCVDCGKIYNVSKYAVVHSGRYICPCCYYKNRPTKAKLKANA